MASSASLQHHGSGQRHRTADHSVRHAPEDAAPQYHDAPQAASAKPKKKRVLRSTYTFGHSGRSVRVGPVAFWTSVGSLVVMACWTIVTGTYFAFEEDVLTRLVARQTEMQFAYEDRIAEMRAQVDRVTGRQLLDQEQFEQKLEQIMRKQAVLESRAATIGALADPATTGSIKTPREAPSVPAKPTPMGSNVAPGDRGASLEPRGLSAIVARITGRTASNGGGMNGALARLQESLERVDLRQTATLAAIEDTYDSKARRLRTVLSELGVNVGKPAPAAAGGPFIPFKATNDQRTFEYRLQRISIARTQLDRLSKTLTTVPVRKPVPGELDLSSGFGVRSDPFLNRPAMHTGLDFRGDTGDPVHATAAGTVTTAGRNGGYGKMVEIDHGQGFTTRYGHLSEISVTVGQNVRPGQLVGKVGSTGRSTGPHLHYETRIEGDAVDPHRFLRAGAKLGLVN
jgi:murein DD-endopeptidase MepM/ murein hydrolase activator NlpD